MMSLDQLLYPGHGTRRRQKTRRKRNQRLRYTLNRPDPEEEDPDHPDVILETHAAALHGLPPDCPFTFLYLSSEDSTRDVPWIL